MRKLIGAFFAVVFIIAIEAVTYWSVLDPALQALRRSGASGNMVAQIALSPLFTLVLAAVAIGLAIKGIAELRDGRNETTPPQVHAQPSIHIENNPVFSQTVVPAPDRAPRERPIANVVFLGVETIHLHVEGQPSSEWFYQSDDGSGLRAFVACFRNDVRDYGVRIADTLATAQLILRAEDGKEIGKGILGACWVDDRGDYFELDAGKSGCVILGVIFKEGEFFVPWRRRERTDYGDMIVTEMFEASRKPATVEVRLIGSSNQLLLEPTVINLSHEYP
jgi:hypothetical protein